MFSKKEFFFGMLVSALFGCFIGYDKAKSKYDKQTCACDYVVVDEEEENDQN